MHFVEADKVRARRKTEAFLSAGHITQKQAEEVTEKISELPEGGVRVRVTGEVVWVTTAN